MSEWSRKCRGGVGMFTQKGEEESKKVSEKETRIKSPRTNSVNKRVRKTAKRRAERRETIKPGQP